MLNFFQWSDGFNQEYTTYSLIKHYILDREAVRTHYLTEKEYWVNIYRDPDEPIPTEEEEEQGKVAGLQQKFQSALGNYKNHVIIVFVSYFDQLLSEIFNEYLFHNPAKVIELLTNDDLSIKEVLKEIFIKNKKESIDSYFIEKAVDQLNAVKIEKRVQNLERILNISLNKLIKINLFKLYEIRNKVVHEDIEIDLTDEIIGCFYETIDVFIYEIFISLQKINIELSKDDIEYFQEVPSTIEDLININDIL